MIGKKKVTYTKMLNPRHIALGMKKEEKKKKAFVLT